jgi:hypothetical protein
MVLAGTENSGFFCCAIQLLNWIEWQQRFAPAVSVLHREEKTHFCCRTHARTLALPPAKEREIQR